MKVAELRFTPFLTGRYEWPRLAGLDYWRRSARVLPEASRGPRYRCAPKRPVRLAVVTSGGVL